MGEQHERLPIQICIAQYVVHKSDLSRMKEAPKTRKIAARLAASCSLRVCAVRFDELGASTDGRRRKLKRLRTCTTATAGMKELWRKRERPARRSHVAAQSPTSQT